MMRTWPGQTKEEWMAEFRRDAALTPEERKKEWDEKIAILDQEWAEYKKKNTVNTGQDHAEWMYIHAENPHSLDDGEATVTWLIVMIVGSIFNDRLLIWIMATAIYLGRMFRYNIRKWKWDNGGKEEYYQKIEDAFKGDKK